jgi:glycogen debranching enzyme
MVAALRPPAPDNAIRVSEQFYILAKAAAADDRTRVLKHNETFALLDRFGDIQPLGLGEEGLYHEGTRFLSRLVLRLGEDRPLMLSSTVTEDNAQLQVHLTNPDIAESERVAIPRGTLHLLRSITLWRGVCYERLQVRNYGLFPVRLALHLDFEADFVDIFEVRGQRRPQRGERLPNRHGEEGAVLAYCGVDGVLRCMRILCAPAPEAVADGVMTLALEVAPRAEVSYEISKTCFYGSDLPDNEAGVAAARRLTGNRGALAYESAVDEMVRTLDERRSGWAGVISSNERFNAWIDRSGADFQMMISETEFGLYPFAGVPWFNAPFGRDGVIAALEMLWVEPAIARGVLGFLAATQSGELAPERDAQPGKILHEARLGEMAALGEIPFGRYYGSIDGTPLFVFFAGLYYKRTGDLEFIRSLWPSICAGLEWIERWGDLDGDGFVEYARQTPKGLVQQGWKDSNDSIFHADGSLAPAPIALCEVQAYVYGAKRQAAGLAEALGESDLAARLRTEAKTLRDRFERAFWIEEFGTYALALDGEKRPCKVHTSNAGHCLLTGIAAPERARRVANALCGGAMFSGWGVRTVADTECRYNPMSYHNGSVWPHDNAVIALGMARYGERQAALKLLEGLFAASTFFDLHRLPELFCGFARRSGEAPTLYPVACAPQAWAAGAVFLLLQAVLGLRIDGTRGEVVIAHPALPESINRLILGNLRVGDSRLDLLVERHGEHVGTRVLRKEGPVRVLTIG